MTDVLSSPLETLTLREREVLKLVAEGYKIDNGLGSVPEAPGFGLTINEEKFRQVRVHFDIKS